MAAANDVTDRAMSVATAAAAAHASVIIENPVWRGAGSPWGKPEYRDHCSLWDMFVVMRWRRRFGAESVDCAQCAFGGEFQKLTTFLYTPDLHAALVSLDLRSGDETSRSPLLVLSCLTAGQRCFTITSH